MVRSHCINHRLALACSDANGREVYPDHRSYPSSVVERLEYSKRCSAFVKVCVSLQKIKLAYANDDPTKQKKLFKSLAVKYRKLAGQGGFQLAKVFQASAETFLP